MWVQAEIIAMATDIAEFLGAALGLNLLFGVPLFVAGVMTGVIAFGILELRARVPPLRARDHRPARDHLPRFPLRDAEDRPVGARQPRRASSRLGRRTEALYLAVGIIGATVMPHAIYLHSALTKGRMPVRNDAERSRVLRFERIDVIIALGLAGLINMGMLAVAAKLFHAPVSPVSTRSGARTPGSATSSGAAPRSLRRRAARLRRLLLERRHVRRAGGDGRLRQHPDLALHPAPRDDGPGARRPRPRVSPTSALVLSQVVLSFGIPFALVPLVLLTSRRDVMGVHVNRRSRLVRVDVAALISALNVFLLAQAAGLA